MNRASDELHRWEIAVPEIAEYLEQVESEILKGTNKHDTHNHEDNPTHNAMKGCTTVDWKIAPSQSVHEGFIYQSRKRYRI